MAHTGSYVVKLPGTSKLSTTCPFLVGKHSLSVNAFVVRHPDENNAAVHRWLLERNLKLYGVGYAIDFFGHLSRGQTPAVRGFRERDPP